jgi:4-hydroxythreonine-4-phosphate dehydrogenase
MASRAEQLGIDVSINDYADTGEFVPGHLNIVPVGLERPSNAGHLDPANAGYVLATLETAVRLCETGVCSAMVTGPVNKALINEAGTAFTGHTEWLAQRTGATQVVMMLATSGLKVALATTHLPLRAVADAITQTLIENVATVLHHELRSKFGIIEPHILVLGLNPHAGEGGHLGREEIDVITPAIKSLAHQGIRITGPLPADTAFTPHILATVDVVLAMYHDQGLPVLKFKGFGNAANITLGLPIIRTSVDHGTAVDIAGTGTADASSLITAIEYASLMSSNCPNDS